MFQAINSFLELFFEVTFHLVRVFHFNKDGFKHLVRTNLAQIASIIPTEHALTTRLANAL